LYTHWLRKLIDFLQPMSNYVIIRLNLIGLHLSFFFILLFYFSVANILFQYVIYREKKNFDFGSLFFMFIFIFFFFLANLLHLTFPFKSIYFGKKANLMLVHSFIHLIHPFNSPTSYRLLFFKICWICTHIRREVKLN